MCTLNISVETIFMWGILFGAMMLALLIVAFERIIDLIQTAKEEKQNSKCDKNCETEE